MELNHCLWIFSPLYNNHLYDSSKIFEHYILFTLSMHHFNLIEPLSSPCLILQQELLSGSVSLYMKCWLDFHFTPLYWERDSNPCHMLERHIAWTNIRYPSIYFLLQRYQKYLKYTNLFLVSFIKFQSIHPYPSHDESIASK